MSQRSNFTSPIRCTSRLPQWCAAGLLASAAACALAGQVDIVGPPGGASFGAQVLALPNGNFVVGDPLRSDQALNAGAVYLYSAGGMLISTLTGSHANDHVGESLKSLGNGNFVVTSSAWNEDRGAVTWINGTTGLSGHVSASNSLVGSSVGDYVGDAGDVVVVGDHNYVVISGSWSNGNAVQAGAVTWCSGASGCTGPVSTDNSLYGISVYDHIGAGYFEVLSNGNYVLTSLEWDFPGGASDAGAITWGNGNSGTTGAVSPGNSLVGTHTGDVAYSRVVPLSNGNYVVGLPDWDNGAVPDVGAAVWGNGTAGVAGTVSAANALVGVHSNDRVGYSVTALSNGHYVVSSPFLDAGTLQDVGAVTWGNGDTGMTGVVTEFNSLTGPGNLKGPEYVYALTNGNYVVTSPNWDAGGAPDLGAVTWVNGTTTTSGTVSAANSLIGSSAYDSVGLNVVALSNGNYVVASPYWDGVAQGTGAVTWANGNTGLVGTVSAANSLVGSRAYDAVGMSVLALSNGNYVVDSYFWNSPSAVSVGAVTWGNGASGLVGTVSAANSLIGASAYDTVGGRFDMDGLSHPNVIALNNGNYAVSSTLVDLNGHVNAGAVTWGNGATGTVGTVGTGNSLYGSSDHDEIGDYLVPYSDGNFVFPSYLWDDAALADVGAVTLGNGAAPMAGPITPHNSVPGTVGDIRSMSSDYDAVHHKLLVGRPDINAVTVFTLDADAIFADGFDGR